MSDAVICRNCGFANAPGDEFCGSCGTFLEWHGTPASGGAASSPAGSTPAGGAAAGGAAAGAAGSGPAAGGSVSPDAPTAVNPTGDWLTAQPPAGGTQGTAGGGQQPGGARGGPGGQAGSTAGAQQGGGTIRCWNCGTANPPERTFCMRCGERLATAGAAAGAAGAGGGTPPSGGVRHGRGRPEPEGSKRGLMIAGLIAAILLLVGAAAVVGFLAAGGDRDPGGASASPTSLTGVESPSPSASEPLATGSASPSPAASASPSSAPTAPLTAPPTSSPPPPPTTRPTDRPTDPPPTPSPTPEFPFVKVKLQDVGFEDPSSPESLPKVVSFTSDGTDEVYVRVDDVSNGEIEVCFQFEDRDPTCRTGTDVRIRGLTRNRSTGWHARVQGATPGIVTTADIEVYFPARFPSLELADFRFAGVSGASNGLVAEFRGRRGGDMNFNASWEVPADYSLVVTSEDPSEPGYEDSGVAASSVSATVPLQPRGRYRLTFGNPTSFEEIHFNASLTLP